MMTVFRKLLTGVMLSFGFVAMVDGVTTASEWKFEEEAGTPLTGLVNSTGGPSFTGDGHGIAATGDGALRVRRGRSGGALYYAPLQLEGDGPVWLGVEIREWDLRGPAEEAVRFGLAHEASSGGALVDIRLERTSEGVVAMEGIGHGGGTRIEAEPLFANPRREPLYLALEYEPSEHRYAVYHRNGNGEWEKLGGGATRSNRTANYLRLNFVNRFDDTPEERFDIDRIVVSRRPFFTSTATEAREKAGGQPWVSAWSWVVADGQTGEILAGHEADAFRKTASITKAMTALLVVRLAENNPSILDETIVFSERASAARGSHTGLQAGEGLSVRDALFGLMLPSGNDAGNAIAEHFNDRLDPPEDPESVPASRIGRHHWVAEMNRAAAELGMKNTIYRISFGDGGSATDHTSTAEDLVLLAMAGMGHPLFREVVGSKIHTATVLLPEGGTREITWNNSNQFLGRPGFDGIKTGTTRNAGACLLSTAVREENRLIVVVLGSAYRDRRYLDSELLYEWAWNTFFPNP